MADKSGLMYQDPYASPTNPYGQKRPGVQSQARNPYQGGIQTQFADTSSWKNSPGFRPQNSEEQGYGGYQATQKGDNWSVNDPDVMAAQRVYNELQHPNQGSSHDDLQSRFNMYQGRIGQKNALSDMIGAAPDQLADQESLLKLEAGQGLGQGLKATRENYNRRGLLYSGLRQGAETQKRNQVAGALSSGLMGARRESANAVSKAQDAYAHVGLAREEESFQLANQAFETAHANMIARSQAMQQLGGGLGSAAGTFAGRSNPQQQSTAITQPLEPLTGQQPVYPQVGTYDNYIPFT